MKAREEMPLLRCALGPTGRPFGDGLHSVTASGTDGRKAVITRNWDMAGSTLKKPIRGRKMRVGADITDPNSPRIYLKEGIECNFGRLKLMASRCKVGDTVYVDGILNISDEGNIFLDPAVKRDPTAKFIPIKAEGK